MNEQSSNRTDGCNYIVVMRHSRRKDDFEEVNEDAQAMAWGDRVQRPHDPPIFDFELPVRSCKDLHESLSLKIDAMKVSPYRRCLQTAAALVPHLPFLQQITIDLGLSEVALRACNSFSMMPDATATIDHLSLEDIKRLFHEHGCTVELESIQLVGDPAVFAESPSDSMLRFQRAVDSYLQDAKQDVLVVTHGDCLNAIANARGKIVFEAP